MFVARQSDGQDVMLGMLASWLEEHGIIEDSPNSFVTMCYPTREVIHHGSDFNMHMSEPDFHHMIDDLTRDAVMSWCG
eukprot:SAG11_NODE_2762_length_3000_cov_3.166494_2_plen_78_part_00